MSGEITIGIIALVSISACGLILTLVTFRMVEKVKQRLPKEEQIGELGWYFSKTLRLHREYKRLYGHEHLLLDGSPAYGAGDRLFGHLWMKLRFLAMRTASYRSTDLTWRIFVSLLLACLVFGWTRVRGEQMSPRIVGTILNL